MVILILSYEPGISLHVPLPMNVANVRYHSLLGDNIFQFWFTLRVSTASFKRLGEKACVPSPRRSHADNWQLYGRSTLMTGSCSNGMPEYMNEFNLDFRKYQHISQPSSEAQKVVSTS